MVGPREYAHKAIHFRELKLQFRGEDVLEFAARITMRLLVVHACVKIQQIQPKIDPK